MKQYARIIAVSDVFDAMSSRHCYRKALSIDIIEEGVSPLQND